MGIEELSEQEIIRRKSLKELETMGVDAYPAREFGVTAHAAEIKASFTDAIPPREVVIAGRMMRQRDRKSVV